MLTITVGRTSELEGIRRVYRLRGDYALVATDFKGPSAVGGPWNSLFWRWLVQDVSITPRGGSGVLYTLSQVDIEKDDPDRYTWNPRDKSRFAGEFVVYLEEGVRSLLVAADERTIEYVASDLVSQSLTELSVRALRSSPA